MFKLFTFLFLFTFVSRVFALESIIYGIDNRVEVSQSSIMLQGIAKSVAAMIPSRKIYTDNNVTFLNSFFSLGQKYGLCEEEKFYNQPSVSQCSGFLVGKDILVTAGHCLNLPYRNGVKPNACKDFKWVFDYNPQEDGFKRTNVSKVYTCKSILYLETNSKTDLGIIKLDREVSHTKGLPLSDLTPSQGERLSVIGHPSGLPKKVTTNAHVTRNIDNEYRYYISSDTFEGNSGSPVLNYSGDVVGMVISGKTDYVYDDIRGCQTLNSCNDVGNYCTYRFDKNLTEGIGKISHTIKDILQIKGL